MTDTIFKTKKAFNNFVKRQGGGNPRLDLVQQFLAWLKSLERHEAKEGFYYWPLNADGTPNPEGRLQAGVCTSSARIIARRFGGYVLGYHADTNSGAAIRPHDFALCGTLAIDYWAHFFSQVSPAAVLDLSDSGQRREALRLYGDPERWELTVPQVNFNPASADLLAAVKNGYDWFGRPMRNPKESVICLLRSQGMDYMTAAEETARMFSKMKQGFNRFSYGGVTFTIHKNGQQFTRG